MPGETARADLPRTEREQRKVKLKMENIVASIRVLTGAFAFLITIIVGGLLYAEPWILLVSSIIVAVFFYVMGGQLSRILDRINYEVTDIERYKFDDEDNDKGGVKVGSLIDISQSAETPFK